MFFRETLAPKPPPQGPTPPPPPQPTPTVPVPPTNVIAALPSQPEWGEIKLPPLLKGWAKGSRLVFLTERIPLFKAALQQSKTKGNDYIDQTYTAYYDIYPWDLSLDLEPLPVQLPLPLPLPLTPYEQALKRAHMQRMKKVSYTSNSSRSSGD